MKIKLLIIAIVAILVTACTTGTQMTRTYDDDIYFSPGDVPPVSMASQDAQERTSNSDARNQRMVISELDQNDDGSKTLNNHIYESDGTRRSGNQSYNMNQQELAESDTTIYYNDDDVKYVINNYYEGNDLDFTSRIHRFHRPYYYSPFFYDDWNYGFYSGYYPGYSGWGYYDPWYYGGWGYPYSYGYYSPFAIGLGFGGYWGGGYGGYYSGYSHGYYHGYYGSGGGGYYNTRDVAKRRSTEMNMPNRNTHNTNTQIGGSRTSGLKSGSYGNDSDQQLPRGVSSSSGYSRGRAIHSDGINNGDTKSATIVNNRRPGSASGTQVQSENGSPSQVSRPGTSTSGNVRRSYEPSTTGRTYDQGRAVNQGQNYTPSYNKPRIVNQSNYNNNSYTRPTTSGAANERGTIVKSAPASGSGTQTYSAPRSSSNMRETYRSSQSYSSGSSAAPSRSSSPTYSSPSSSPSYSAPAQRSSGSSSGGSYGGGSSGGSSSGSSSGGSSGGGGGSGHRR